VIDKDKDRALLVEMKEKIEGIEGLVHELKELGKGAPVVEQNARAILSLTYVLKFGIGDVAEIMDKERR